MIVRVVDEDVQLITQPDHAHLAGRIMEHCVELTSRPRRASILLAIAEHDNGWEEEDRSPSVDSATGAVVDFVTAPLSVRHAVWPRAIARLGADPWAAALVAQHAITVYERFRTEDAWASFFDRMRAAREEMLDASGLPRDELRDDYAFVRLADLISLTFCTRWSDVQRFDGWTVRLADERVIIEPDAFGGRAVPIAVDATVVDQRAFRSDAELREALTRASTTTLRGEVVGPASSAA